MESKNSKIITAMQERDENMNTVQLTIWLVQLPKFIQSQTRRGDADFCPSGMNGPPNIAHLFSFLTYPTYGR